mmetsp:Transcript_45875/g.33627  ORF Transcript_45875/g.33627 Transcript_45875/m.33627 type:complete len:117 (+) Transcript_45875:207-557(+)
MLDQGWKGVIYGSHMLIFAIFGYDVVFSFSDETVDPVKTVPLSIIWSLFWVTLLYVFLSISIYGMGPLHLFNEETAFPDLFSAQGFEVVSIFIYAVGFLGLIGATLSNYFQLPRCF